MAINILSLVTQMLTPELIGRIASALGLDRLVAQEAIGASIPALLASLAGIASQPAGAKQLSNTLAQQKPGALDSMMEAIGGSGQKALTDSGNNMLSSLLGSGTMGALASAIARSCGIGDGASKSLLGTLGPIVLGALGQQQRATGMDPSGAVALLASQKDRITAAIPSDLAQHMSGSGLLDAVDAGVRRGAAATTAAAGRVGSTADQLSARASELTRRPAPAQWPYWVLAAAVLSGLGWYLLGGPWGNGDRVAQEPTQGTVGVAVPNLTVGNVDLGKQVNESVDNLKSALAGITDESSAQAALPKIRDAKAQLDNVSAMADRLPAEGKQSLAKFVAAAMPAINGLLDKVMAMPGVGPIASPVIEDLRTRLKALATA